MRAVSIALFVFCLVVTINIINETAIFETVAGVPLVDTDWSPINITDMNTSVRLAAANYTKPAAGVTETAAFIFGEFFGGLARFASILFYSTLGVYWFINLYFPSYIADYVSIIVYAIYGMALLQFVANRNAARGGPR